MARNTRQAKDNAKALANARPSRVIARSAPRGVIHTQRTVKSGKAPRGQVDVTAWQAFANSKRLVSSNMGSKTRFEGVTPDAKRKPVKVGPGRFLTPSGKIVEGKLA